MTPAPCAASLGHARWRPASSPCPAALLCSALAGAGPPGWGTRGKARPRKGGGVANTGRGRPGAGRPCKGGSLRGRSQRWGSACLPALQRGEPPLISPPALQRRRVSPGRTASEPAPLRGAARGGPGPPPPHWLAGWLAAKMAAAKAAWACRGAGRAAVGGLWSAAVPRRPFSNDQVRVELDESSGVAVMTLKSPPVNSLSLELLTEFTISLEKLENDKACRGVILTSAVPKIFSAGLDIMEMSGKTKEHYAEFWKAVQEMWLKLYGSSLATVAAINGSSPAGGCLMALSCDYRIMAENPEYSIGLNETQLGIVAPFWFKDAMVSTIGHRATERSLQLGLLYPAPDALKVGLVDKLVPEEKMQSVATRVMSQWLATPDHARQITKSMMRKGAVEHLLKHRESDVQNFVSFVSRDSIQKALQAYVERLKQRKG
ncbi:enoyl-CoA delta isomerase 1, mitochondrial [Paroedura picta]|uniref:enoyl-CoA delta isomerase 1, mitochondrial n=1 Tax=Paroedura picta TaxID=143630 RepID=UPI004056C7FA